MEKLLERLDINSLIKSANNGTYCGTECKMKQKETELRENVNKAAINMKTSPEKYEEAQAEYIRFLHGDAKYDEYKFENDKKEFLKSIQEQTREINKNSDTLTEIGKNNKYLINTTRILENNIKDENEKINDLVRSLDALKSKIDTTRQKTTYEGENNKYIRSVFKINNVMFYILLVLSVVIYYYRFGRPTVKMGGVLMLVFIYNLVVDYYTLS